MKNHFALTAMQSLSLGFAILILMGTFLLMLPISVMSAKTVSFLDALFTATSAVSTTGLGVVDTGSFFSRFGQTVILVLIQIGGLGYMIFIGLLLLGFKKRLSLGNTELLHESIARPSSEDVIKFSKKIIVFTVFFEALGLLLFISYWSRFLPFHEALYTSLFHSVSAFCTAGFSLYSDSLTAYRDSLFFNCSVMFICFSGSIGFFVLNDLYLFLKKFFRRKYPWGFSAHTKLAVSVMGLLIIAGIFVICFLGEAAVGSTFKEQVVNSTFQVVSAVTTTGFNTVDIGRLSDAGLWLIAVLMFAGACPGGTAGGIKTTTLGLISLSVYSLLMGREGVNVFYRRVPQETIMRAYAIAVIVLIWIVIAMGIMLVSEKEASALAVLFEITSAAGTVGLSTGITSSLSVTGKIVIIMTMFLGRVGPIAIGYSLIGKPRPVNFAYSKAQILVG
ncbi:MAG: potassium transporter TrkG [Candidatus Omnitrophota bacterium]